jgi:hypothetical protein
MYLCYKNYFLHMLNIFFHHFIVFVIWLIVIRIVSWIKYPNTYRIVMLCIVAYLANIETSSYSQNNTMTMSVRISSWYLHSHKISEYGNILLSTKNNIMTHNVQHNTIANCTRIQFCLQKQHNNRHHGDPCPLISTK